MKLKLAALVALTCVLALAFFFADSPNAGAQGNNLPSEKNFSPAEQEVLTEINQARTHPDVYANYLEGLKPFFNGKEYKNGQLAVTTAEGWGAVEEAIRFLRAAKPQSPLSLSRGLSLAASLH